MAIQTCCLARDFNILPAGDSTEIGEKGTNLSGGQKARIALARAVYAGRPLLLLDDPLQALDVKVKTKIFQNLKKLQNTRILVTHSIEFLEMVDEIVLMDKGRIAISGTYE